MPSPRPPARRRFARAVAAFVLLAQLATGARGQGSDGGEAGQGSEGRRVGVDVEAAASSGVTSDAEACRLPVDGRAVVVGAGVAGDPFAPEPASGYRLGLQAVRARRYLVVTAHSLASRAGCEVLKAGGSAVDAAVAVQMVLGLVEPQSSGLGGGGFLLHYDAATRSVQAYDGRETAPAAATENHLRWIDDTADRTPPQPGPRASGRAIGTPGIVRLLELAHRDHGRRPWRDLFAPAIRLARGGFPIGGRLAAAIASARESLRADAEAAATYLDADGAPRRLGSSLVVPNYADTLQALADGGADAFYGGAIAQAVVDKIGATRSAVTGAGAGADITPGKTTLADLAGYEAKRREPVCTRYRAYEVCGMPPPSSGGLAVAQTLGILEHFDLTGLAPASPEAEGGRPQARAVHLVSEAERLAYADRDRYVADVDFVPLPAGGVAAMTDADYLRRRAGLIHLDRNLGTAPAGDFGAAPAGVSAQPEAGTTHVTIVDAAGNVVALTSTIESSFGSFHMTRGFVLNNQLTDFSFAPADAAGRPIANRVAAGKRPRSSMAPTLVFRRDADGGRGDFVMATGSPGGSSIIQYVVKTLVGVLDWRLDAQQASALVDFGAANGPTTFVGGEHPSIVDPEGGGRDDPLVAGLRALGHTVSTRAQSSGVATIVRVPAAPASAASAPARTPRLQGGADPRREGVALGDGG